MSMARVREDPSLSLLARISDDAMDPSYAEVAAQAENASTNPASRSPGYLLALVLAALGLLVTAGVLQIRAGAPDAQQTRAQLADRATAAAATTDALAADVQRLEQRVAGLRDDALQGTEADRALSEELAQTASIVGLAPVRGPGIDITLDDGPSQPATTGGVDLARVLDQDLQSAVNSVFAAGAEAVSINGQRLTSLSAIRGAGDAILVGYRPVSPPYVISAIGDPATLEDNFQASPAAGDLRDLAAVYGVRFDVDAAESLQLPAQDQPPLRYASVVEAS